MKAKIALIFVVVALIIGQLAAAPFVDADTTKCYDRLCPPRTTACKRVVKTSHDKKYLDTTVYCMDIQDMVLQEHHEKNDNPHGPYTHYESTSFSGTYIYTSKGHQPLDIHINNNIGGGFNSRYGGVEDFS